MKKLQFNELDKFIKDVDSLYEVSHDKAYKKFSEVELEYPTISNLNPFSQEYKNKIFNLYKKISGNQVYEVKTEESFVDIESAIYKPYPYLSNSVKRLALYHKLLGKLMSMVDINSGDCILDMGCGWGCTSLEFANIGMNVTALDINRYFCELVKERAALNHINSIKVINDDFLWIERTSKKFDAIIFFECFHHCWDFERLLKGMHKVLSSKGKIYFAAEPISDIFPIPWSLRLDGESLFVIRKHGWMELGFTKNFFRELLHRNGWLAKEIEDGFWEASPIINPIIIKGNDRSIKSNFFIEKENSLVIKAPENKDNILTYGPYISLLKGDNLIEISFENHTLNNTSLYYDIVYRFGTKILVHKRKIPYSQIVNGYFKKKISLKEDCENVEFRLYGGSGLKIEIKKIIITNLPNDLNDILNNNRVKLFLKKKLIKIAKRLFNFLN